MALVNAKAEVKLAEENLENAEIDLKNVRKHILELQVRTKHYDDEMVSSQREYEAEIEDLRYHYNTISEANRKKFYTRISEKFHNYQVTKLNMLMLSMYDQNDDVIRG